ALDVPLVIVARIGLGTINHTCLTVEAARSRGLEIAGVIFTRAEDPEKFPPGPDEARNPEAIARQTGVKVIANLPYNPEIPEVVLPL
ncbi:MAG: ATP-dependent dethiobiotin synthetase BioD, partial [Planctomycetota bacterium]